MLGLKRTLLFIVIYLLSLCCLAKASDNIIIQIHFFQGTWTEGQPGLQQAKVLTTLSCPELSSIKDKITDSEYELKVAVIDILMEVFDLAAIDHLFLHKKQWNGLGKPSMKDLTLSESSTSYEIKLRPRMLPTQQVSLQIVILGGKVNLSNLSGDMETFIDQEIVLNIDDPVIISVPYKDGAYFAMVVVKTGALADIKLESKKADKIDLVAAPKAINQVQPLFPEELRRRRIGGEIDLQITINEKGVVQKVEVVKPNHPYHNYSAVQAFRQWIFEPVLRKGKPVPAKFFYTYYFDPVMYRRERIWSDTYLKKSDVSSDKELLKVLSRSGDYCQGLKSAVYDFICEEAIKETHYNLIENIHWGVLVVSVTESAFAENDTNFPRHRVEERARVQIIDPKRTLRNKFLSDYQIIKKVDSIKEQRIILKINGQKIKEEKNLLEETRFSGLSSLFAPIRVLAKDQQSKFDYRIIKEEKVHGKRTYMIEALPKFGNENEIWSARIWVDKKSFQIRKCEIEGIPIDGYEDVLNDCAILNIKPKFVIIHEYRTEKNKILFPSRSKLRVTYPGIDFRGDITKINMNLTYDKYKFFTVETDHKVIKKTYEDFFFQHNKNKPIFKNSFKFIPCLLKYF